MSASPSPCPCFELNALTVSSRRTRLLDGVSWSVPDGLISSLVGPSGAGKSTLLRCLNRLIDLTPGLETAGEVRFRGRCVRADKGVDRLRERIGMVFQQPVLFPGSIHDNVVFGVRRLRRMNRAQLDEVTEQALREAVLWDEVRDRLRARAEELSVGQQQRLCLARALAAGPEVVLLDEPTSALDRRSAEAIERWMLQQRGRRTVVLVTHSLDQMRRVADRTGLLHPGTDGGELVFNGPTSGLAEAPLGDDVRQWLGL